MEEKCAHHVLFCGYFLLPKLRGPVTIDLMKSAHARGSLIWFDTGWDPDDWDRETVAEIYGILPHVDVFVPNEDEARTLTGVEDPAQQVTRLIGAGARQVIIKLGDKGALAATAKEMVHVPGRTVEVKDTTGAGDVFNAGCLYGMIREWTTEKMLEFANSLAACYISSAPRRFPFLEDVRTS